MSCDGILFESWQPGLVVYRSICVGGCSCYIVLDVMMIGREFYANPDRSEGLGVEYQG